MGWKELVSAWSIGGFAEPQAKKSWTCQSQLELSDGADVTGTLISSVQVSLWFPIHSLGLTSTLSHLVTWEIALPTAYRGDQCVFSERNLGHLSQGSGQQSFARRLLS